MMPIRTGFLLCCNDGAAAEIDTVDKAAGASTALRPIFLINSLLESMVFITVVFNFSTMRL
jgi:hypothetical protein